MGRTHVEHVHSPEVAASGVVWPGWPAGAHVKVLSHDERSGALTGLLYLPAGYQRPEGYTPSQREVIVVNGSLRIGDDDCEPLTYDYSPSGATEERWETAADTELLFMTRNGPADIVSGSGAASPAHHIRIHGTALPWGPTPVPNGPPNIEVAVLRYVEETGEMSALVRGNGAREYLHYEFHDCVEEVYLIGGDITLGNSGPMYPGSYFWRPPYVTHGQVTSKGGSLAYLYVDSQLVNHFTDGFDRTSEENRRQAEREAAAVDG